MRVSYISHLFPTERNPSYGIFMKRFVDVMNGDDLDFDIYIPTVRSFIFTRRWRENHAPLLNEAAKRVFYVSYPRRNKPRFVQNNIGKALRKKIIKDQTDIIHVNWVYPDGLAVSELKKIGKPVIMHIHGADWYENHDNPQLRPFVKEAVHAADQVWVVGTKLKEDIGNAYSELRNKIKVVPNSIDCSKFSCKENKFELREKLGWEANKTHLLQVAHFRREKGQKDLVEAFRLLNLGKDVCLHLVGAPFDVSYYEEVLSKVEEYNDLNIRIHPAIAPNELPQLLSAADLFILPSRIEGFGVALIEAGACGVPLLSTKSGGPEDIINSDIGMLAESSSFRSLSKALNEMLSKLDQYEADIIKSSIRKRFDSKIIKNKVHALYTLLLGKGTT